MGKAVPFPEKTLTLIVFQVHTYICIKLIKAMPKPGESIGTVKVDEIIIVSLGNKLGLKKSDKNLHI